MRQEQELVCPICKKASPVTDPNTGEILCKRCGAVIKSVDDATEIDRLDIIDSGELIQTRNANSALFDNHGVMSYVGLYDKDAHGSKVDASQSSRLRFMDFRVKSGAGRVRARSIQHVSRVISSICDRLGLKYAVREEIASMYHRHYSKQFQKGRSVDGLVAVYTYVVCRNKGIMRTIKQICDAAGVKTNEFNRIQHLVYDKLGIRTESNSVPELIPGLCTRLGLPGKVERKALEAWEIAKSDSAVTGKSPLTLSTLFVYMAMKTSPEHFFLTQADFAREGNVTEISIRNNHTKLRSLLSKAFPR